MSYYDLPQGNADVEMGRSIYMNALHGRRGFRYDHLGIEDTGIWSEIFEGMGVAVRHHVSHTGFVIVPAEATPSMKSAGADAFFSPEPKTIGEENERAGSVYRRMIKTAAA